MTSRHRRSIRLKGHDYSSAGSYFVTLCARDRECLFGSIAAGVMRLNAYGMTVRDTWQGLPGHYPHVVLDAFVIMPNHVHGIIETVPNHSTNPCHGLPEIVRAFKTFSARSINQQRGTPGLPVWQRNYWEHIIRDDKEISRIREYIESNPAGWAEDGMNPSQMVDDSVEGSHA